MATMSERFIPMPEEMSINDDRFWSKVDVKSENECWNWLYGLSYGGYGRFGYNGIIYFAHRFAYWLFYNIDPGTNLVCHVCNNRFCCNPHHLYLGTHSENIQQSYDDNRRNNRGSNHPRSKFTDDDVKEIKRLLLHSYLTQRQIALQFNVSYQIISNIANGKRWTHVPWPMRKP